MTQDPLKLENQLCFPLYAASRAVVRRYKPYLDEIDLTYTQYITMMVLWEHEQMNVKAIGERLSLDSGTLTPLLRKLEARNLVRRKRNPADERNLIVELTDEGRALRTRAEKIPALVGDCIRLDRTEAAELYRLLYKVLDSID